MASNFYYGGSQSANMLAHPLKNLSLGPSQITQSLELNPAGSSLAGIGQALSFVRPTTESGLPNNFRSQPSRSNNISDIIVSQMGASVTGGARPPVSGVSGMGGPLYSRQNGSFFKTGDRPPQLAKASDSESQLFPVFRGSLSHANPRLRTRGSSVVYADRLGYIISRDSSAAEITEISCVGNHRRRAHPQKSDRRGKRSDIVYENVSTIHSASRVLSHLQDSSPSSFNNNISSSACAAFVLNRFGGTVDSIIPDGTVNNSAGTHSSQSSSSTAGNLNNMLSIPQSFGGLLTPPIRPIVQSSFPANTPSNSSLSIPPVESCQSLASMTTDINIDGKLSSVNPSGPSLSTQYYTSQQFENTRNLQTSGALKAAPWILVPPVPEGTAAYMRTGRVHELKSRASNDRVYSATHMDHELKQVLHNKVQACLFTSDDATKEKLPRNLGAYTDLIPLEVLQSPRVSVTFGLPCVCFKAWSPRFARPVLLRRVVLPPDREAALSPDAYYLAKQLSELDHPAVIGFRDVFFTNAFDDNSAIVVYEYTPCSSTLQQIHMSDPMKLTSFSSPFNINRGARPHSALKASPSDFDMLDEATVWSYLVQLIHGLRFIHQKVHRACGVLDPTKILIQDGTRLRINCFGLKDVLFHQSQDVNLAEEQGNDFIQLGKLILGAACGTSEAVQTSQRVTAFNVLQRTYRPELVALIRSLVSGQITGIDQLMRATAPFAYDQLSRVSDHSDFLERQLFLGMECDRLFRLVCKLQSIVERNDRHTANPDWSETGDRYMLKLFRDFVFHQTDQLGAPYLDLVHIVNTLNKVEAGSTERLCLVSRDSQNVIIVTYADIKKWLDTSFQHLVELHRQSRCDIQLAQQRQAREQQQQKQQTLSAVSESLGQTPGDDLIRNGKEQNGSANSSGDA
ncbi:unnamed protein product [Calicophoron daubneyi]|uniref:Pan3 C-terminal knob domain-containing protein n=1 Tax=Calicophoron daubneyi TaxID=300641 RepID=A0AAV2T4W9_CALDB